MIFFREITVVAVFLVSFPVASCWLPKWFSSGSYNMNVRTASSPSLSSIGRMSLPSTRTGISALSTSSATRITRAGVLNMVHGLRRIMLHRRMASVAKSVGQVTKFAGAAAVAGAAGVGVQGLLQNGSENKSLSFLDSVLDALEFGLNNSAQLTTKIEETRLDEMVKVPLQSEVEIYSKLLELAALLNPSPSPQTGSPLRRFTNDTQVTSATATSDVGISPSFPKASGGSEVVSADPDSVIPQNANRFHLKYETEKVSFGMHIFGIVGAAGVGLGGVICLTFLIYKKTSPAFNCKNRNPENKINNSISRECRVVFSSDSSISEQ